jgi:quercetin dioxygenase-like cupin family protein
MARVDLTNGIAPQAGSPLAMERLLVDPDETVTVGDGAADVLLFVFHGAGALEGEPVSEGAAALVPAGETAALAAAGGGLSAVAFFVGADTDLHAPIGPWERIVTTDQVEPGKATGSRSFQVLFGPHNGSTRATLFVGYIPPGKAPWHYHLYDEIVWVWHGPGRFHLDDRAEELSSGAAFRLTPREVHIVENLATNREMVVLGLFTPAGSPSAAYLMPNVAAAYAVGPS